MRTFVYTMLFVCCAMTSLAQQKVTVRWELSDKDNLNKSEVTGDADNLLTTNYLNGTSIAEVSPMTSGNADSGYESPLYDPPFMQFRVSTRKTAKTGGHNIAMSVATAKGHTLKATKISFDAAKCGTDGGNFDVCIKANNGSEQTLEAAVSPLRNKAAAGNPNGYSHHEYTLSDVLVEEGNSLVLFLYIYNINGTDDANPKAIAFRNVVIEGVLDEPIFDASHYITAATFKNAAGEQLSLLDIIKGLKNGEQASYSTLLYGDPTDFNLTLAEGYSYTVNYDAKIATFSIQDSNKETVFTFKVLFKVTNRAPKGEAKPLNRGLTSINLSSSGGSGNLISWRSRKADDPNYRFKLFRGTNATTQTTKVNGGNPIMGKTNFLDTSGNASSYYKLEVYDGDGNLVETEISGKTWDKQTKQIPLAAAPIDTKYGASYTPNDAAICDMDGDGEYEIILKWSPSNEKDAASSGNTSNVFFDCYKLDGTQLWRIDLGHNFFASAHTIQFICWDFDGDGYGEFMVKTAPGTVDGEGNYVLLGNDDPNENLKSGRGKQDHGSEYITVFDGVTGAAISTIPYHTNYAAGQSYWGDSNQNRSERYLAGIAWLDGEDANPSPIFARGYYSGAFVGAYDFDGVNLKERWVSRNTQSGKGLWGEGAHWMLVGDCDDDGKQEIVYGSAALDHDGSLLYRTGLGHGDAIHMGNFVTTRPGKEVFMVHEEKPYGYDLRDAKTGAYVRHVTAGGDTGRGLAAHFDHNQESAQFLYSASAAIFNCDTGEELAPAWAIGSSGAGINNRIYWDGDLADEFFDKSIIASWNSDSKWFDRFKINGGNYTEGSLNNGSKNNPCILADILGDWREEIITRADDGKGNHYLIIHSTNYATDYMLPHLMDDLDYRAQVIAQNVCYNQPPHLSNDPIVTQTVHRTLSNVGMTDEFAAKHADMGNYWDCFYTTYPVELPEGITAWQITGRGTNGADTVKVTKLAPKATIPANSGIIYNSKNGAASFRPSIKSATSVNTTYLKGSYCDSTIVSAGTVACYEFRDGEAGLGFYKVDSQLIKGRTGFVRFTSTTTNPTADAYRLGSAINPTYVETVIDVIDAATIVKHEAEPVQYYLPDGRPISNPTTGTYIVKMSDGTTRKVILR